MSWFPLAEDVVSMEKPNIFAEYHLKKDPTCLHEMANAIMSIQALYGFAPVVYGKGAAAKTLYDLTARMKREMQAEEPETQSQIDTMIIFDRQVDLISPLITQLTYEGLIDEFFGNKNSSVKSSSEKYAKNQDDDLFKSGIKCGIHFGGIAPYLEQDYDPQDELMVCD